MILNLGCGNLAIPGALGVDSRQCGAADLILDLECFPWPFADERAEEIWALDIIEHLAPRAFWPFIEECHRVLRPRGLLHLHTGCWTTENSFTDPTHQRFPTEATLDFCVPGTMFGERYPHYTWARFEKLECRMDGQEMLVELRKIDLPRCPCCGKAHKGGSSE